MADKYAPVTGTDADATGEEVREIPNRMGKNRLMGR
jgi:hypothetical protein